jgi:hypothetical protein
VTHSFQLDPCEVLGVSGTASLQEIREAYRSKTKRYHPDIGGDEWAFRVLNRSYELLCTARVAGRATEERMRQSAAQAASGPNSENESATRPPPGPPPEPGKARRGVRDKVDDPSKLVAVEILLLRFEVDDPLKLLVESTEDHNLSCSLNLAWPIAEIASRAESLPNAATILAAIAESFEQVTTKTRVVSARSNVDHGRFTGWLSYTTVARAEDAFAKLRAALVQHGLGIEQWVRDMTIPRTWRD